MKEANKILIVDDNSDLLQILQIILKGQGYQTVLAASVREAEQKIRIHHPAVILLDVDLCDADGRDLCDRLKHTAETKDIRVIMMSGLEESLGDLAWFGADDFLPKPFDYSELTGKVQHHFNVATVYAS